MIYVYIVYYESHPNSIYDIALVIYTYIIKEIPNQADDIATTNTQTPKSQFVTIAMLYQMYSPHLGKNYIIVQILGFSPPIYIAKLISKNNKRHSITTNFRAHALYQVEITIPHVLVNRQSGFLLFPLDKGPENLW